MGGDTTVLIRDTVDITALRLLSTPLPAREPWRVPANDQHSAQGASRATPPPPRPAPHRRATERVKSTGGHVRVGITALPREAPSGMPSTFSAPSIGDAVTAGDSCGEVESTKSVMTSTRPCRARSAATMRWMPP